MVTRKQNWCKPKSQSYVYQVNYTHNSINDKFERVANVCVRVFASNLRILTIFINIVANIKVHFDELNEL